MNDDRQTYAGRPILSEQEAIEAIRLRIAEGRPSAIGKIGGTECKALRFGERWFRPPFPRNMSWRRPGHTLFEQSGVYPLRKDIFYRTLEHFHEILPLADMLVAWFNKGEEQLIEKYAPNAALIPFGGLDCFNHEGSPPWTQALEGKRVLVASPFAESIRKQFPKRREIWAAHPYGMLPDFELLTLKMPLYSYMLKEPLYPDWFTAMEDFQRTMDATDFDVFLIGAGAWSFPLCAYAKKIGRIGIHLGGSNQVLFGVAGRRWLEENPILKPYINEHWTRPSKDETPDKIDIVESGCYW